MNHDSCLPGLMTPKLHYQGAWRGFTAKPFKSPSNKLVATRFQWQADIENPSTYVAHMVTTLYTLGRSTNTIPNKAPPLAPFSNH